MILEHIDQNYDAAYYSGEPIVLEYQELGADGQPVTLAGRVFSLSVYRAEEPDNGFATTGVLSSDSLYVTLTLEGNVTLAFDTVRDGLYQLAETVTLDDGTKWPVVKVAGRLSVETSSAVIVPPLGSLTPTSPVERITRQVRSDGYRLIRTASGAPGPQGPPGPGGTGGYSIVPDAARGDRTTDIVLGLAGADRYFTFQPGIYDVSKGASNWCARIADKSDLTVDLGGSTLVSNYVLANADTTLAPTLQIEGCDGLSVRNARLGYSVSPSASGQVQSIPNDRSGLVFLATVEPPHSTNFDRYVTQTERLGITAVTEYAARDDDYDPSVNYTVVPIDGQAVGQPGRYQIAIPLITAPLATIDTTTTDLTFNTTAPHGLPNGVNVTVTGAQGLLLAGVSIVNDIVFEVNVTSPTSFILQYTQDEPVSTVGATPYVPGTGTITMQRISPDVSVGDTVTLWYRKHLAGPVTVFAARNLSLDVSFDESAGVAVKGRDVDGLNLNIYSRRGSAGCVILRDVRGIVSGNITCDFSGDDLLQIAVGFWGNKVLGPFAAGSQKLIAAGSNYLDVQFATDRTQASALTLPRLRDLVNIAEPTYNNLVATLMVTDVAYLGVAGQYRVTFNGVIPTGVTTDFFIYNASCRPKYRLQSLICRGGGRMFLPKTDDCEVDLIAGYGMNNNIVLSRDPSSPQHPNSGGAAGGFRCRKLIARNSQWNYGNKNPAVLSMRRNGLGNTTTNAASDYTYNFDDADIDGCGYGGVAVSGMNARFGRLVTRGTGQKRSSIPGMAQNPQARNDLFAEWGVCQVDDYDSGGAFTFYEGPGGFVFFPNGSGMRSAPATLAAGAVSFTAAKKVQVGHEARLRVLVGHDEQDPATYVANGTTGLTFTNPPYASGGPVPITVIHERC